MPKTMQVAGAELRKLAPLNEEVLVLRWIRGQEPGVRRPKRIESRLETLQPRLARVGAADDQGLVLSARLGHDVCRSRVQCQKKTELDLAFLGVAQLHKLLFQNDCLPKKLLPKEPF